MRKLVIALILALTWTLAGGSPALAVPAHLHCLTTPGGTHAVALGVTANAPHDALHNFHFNVHVGALADNSPDSPVTMAGISPTGSCD